MKEVSALAGDPKQRPDTSWSQAPSPPAFPTGRVDVWRVRLDELGTAGSEASVLLPMRSRAPADFTSRKTGLTLPDVVLHFGAFLPTTFQFLPPRFASSI
jgi:hypothetical protein